MVITEHTTGLWSIVGVPRRVLARVIPADRLPKNKRQQLICSTDEALRIVSKYLADTRKR